MFSSGFMSHRLRDLDSDGCDCEGESSVGTSSVTILEDEAAESGGREWW
jgi:hypothetical protein